MGEPISLDGSGFNLCLEPGQPLTQPDIGVSHGYLQSENGLVSVQEYDIGRAQNLPAAPKGRGREVAEPATSVIGNLRGAASRVDELSELL